MKNYPSWMTARPLTVVLVAATLLVSLIPAPDLSAQYHGATSQLVGEYSSTPGMRLITVTPTVLTTAPFPAGGITVFTLKNYGSYAVQASTTAGNPTTRDGTMHLGPGEMNTKHLLTPISQLKLHATSGSNDVVLEW